MKKISILAFFSALLFMTSCEEVETPDLGAETQWLQTENGTYSVAENAGDPLVVNVLYAADSNPNGVTVNFTVESSDPSRYEVMPASGTIEIPAGEFVGQIIIDPVNNFDIDGDEEITIEISSTDDVALGIAGEGIYNQTAVVTVVDDDCPVDIESFVGTYSVEEVFSEGGTNAGLSLAEAFGESYQLEISILPGDETGTKLVINNSAGYNEYFEEGTVITLNTCAGTFSFDAGSPLIAVFANMNVQVATYNEEAHIFAASGPLGTYGPYEFMLTKIE